jgi:hypothetical protein
LDLSTFLIVLSGKNKKNGFYFSEKRSILNYDLQEIREEWWMAKGLEVPQNYLICGLFIQLCSKCHANSAHFFPTFPNIKPGLDKMGYLICYRSVEPSA